MFNTDNIQRNSTAISGPQGTLTFKYTTHQLYFRDGNQSIVRKIDGNIYVVDKLKFRYKEYRVVLG